MKSSEFFYKYNNKDIIVHLVIKSQRNIYYRVKDGEFYVTAPYLTPKKVIINGLDKFAPRLLKRYEKIHSNFSFEEDYFYFLGEEKSLSELNIKNIEELEGFLRKYGIFYLEKLVRKNEEIMGISKPYKIKLRKTSNQYGSNSLKTHTLSFQLNLLHYSEDIIESVVVHELAHEFERNHSKNFYNIVYKYCPNYKILQKKLKKGIHL